MGNSTGNANKKLRKQARMIKKRGTEISGKKEQATQEKITVQLEEINQKELAKEGRLKRYHQRVKQYRQNRTFQNNKRKSYQQLGGSNTETYQQPDSKETERFWTKIWKPKKHNENAEWINNITREIKDLKKAPKRKYTSTHPKQHRKEYQTGKCLVMMEYMASGSRNSPPFTADLL